MVTVVSVRGEEFYCLSDFLSIILDHVILLAVAEIAGHGPPQRRRDDGLSQRKELTELPSQTVVYRWCVEHDS